MLVCDMHTHTIKSRCGYATPLEMMNYAAEIGLSAIAITDHGTCSGGYISHALFRLPECYKDVRVFKGVEINITNDVKSIGLPIKYLDHFDIILGGFHYNIAGDQTPAQYSRYLLDYFAAHPYIDVVSHPSIKTFPLDFELIVPELVNRGVAFEVNNKNLISGKTNLENLYKMISLVITHGGKFIFNSDAHTVFELGDDSGIKKYVLPIINIPEDLIVNRNIDTITGFIESRRLNKTSCVSKK